MFLPINDILHIIVKIYICHLKSVRQLHSSIPVKYRPVDSLARTRITAPVPRAGPARPR